MSRSIPEALRNSPEALKKLSDFRVAVEIPISYLTQAIDHEAHEDEDRNVSVTEKGERGDSD